MIVFIQWLHPLNALCKSKVNVIQCSLFMPKIMISPFFFLRDFKSLQHQRCLVEMHLVLFQ